MFISTDDTVHFAKLKIIHIVSCNTNIIKIGSLKKILNSFILVVNN